MVEYYGYFVIWLELLFVVNYYGGSYQVVYVYMDNDWMMGIFGCMEDVLNCVFIMVCLCFVFGCVVEYLDDGNILCIIVVFVWYVIQ